MMAQRSLLGGDSRVDEKTASEGNEELDRMEIRMRMRYGENRRRDKGVPIACDCSAAVLVATSRDPNTRGKLYFSCPYEISDGPGRGCGFMRWWTVALCDEFEKIKEERNEMKQDLDAAKKRIEAQEEKIFLMEEKFEALEKKYQSLTLQENQELITSRKRYLSLE